MLDARLRPLIDPPLDVAGRALAARGVGADGVTLAGLACGLGCAGLVASGEPGWALLPLAASRVLDGLDGAVARASRPSAFGGYLDFTCDVVFYGAVPFGFAVMDPTNALPAAFLVGTFYVNAASLLGFAILVEKRGAPPAARGNKAFHFAAGLLEGTETILFFVLICLFPAWFGPLAWAFGMLCLLTAAVRVTSARHYAKDIR